MVSGGPVSNQNIWLPSKQKALQNTSDIHLHTPAHAHTSGFLCTDTSVKIISMK